MKLAYMFLDASHNDGWYFLQAFHFFLKFAARTSRLPAHIFALEDF
jgi:hypothetical protein